MSLKAQDVLVVLKLVRIDDEEWSFTELAKSLGISIGAAHNAVTHLMAAGLVVDRDGEADVKPRPLLDFLVHGVPAIFYPIHRGIVRGVPTGTSAPPLDEKFPGKQGEPPTVWPLASGRVSGLGLEPLYKTVPKAAASDAGLYELLTLVDVVRVGAAREKKAAVDMLEERILRPVKKQPMPKTETVTP